MKIKDSSLRSTLCIQLLEEAASLLCMHACSWHVEGLLVTQLQELV